MKEENTSKNPTGVKEIARRANVSIATVDRVIHNRSGVSPKTKERILKIIKELNYQPNILASRLASGKIDSIAVILPKASSETAFWDAPLNGVYRAIAEIKQYGIQVTVFQFDLLDKTSFTKAIQFVEEGQFDGLVVAPSFVEEGKRLTTLCSERKIPYIFIDSDLPDSNRLSYIGPPYFKSGLLAGKLLTYRLKDSGKVLIVNITLETESYNYSQIEKGFRSYFMNNASTTEVIRLNIQQSDYEFVSKQLAATLESHPDIKGIFVSNSQVNTVAEFLKDYNHYNGPLIGYDYTPANIVHLEQGAIDFLICHQPENQGFLAVMSLYQHIVLGQTLQKENLMPIDIITKENYEFYKN